MVMSVNTNVLSLTAQRNMMDTQSALGNSIQRLSTGLRINSAKDDAAGLAIAERFTSSIRGGAVAQRNANDGISFAQTAEGALDVIGNNLQRIRELAVQSLNDSNTEADRAAIDQEVQQLTAEVGRIAKNTTFNGRNILDGDLGTLNFQIGAERGQVLAVTGVDARASALGKTFGVVTSNNNAIDATIDYLDDAVFNGAPADTDDFSINGVNISLAGMTVKEELVEAINAKLGDTGVQASIESGKLVLADGSGSAPTLGGNQFLLEAIGLDDGAGNPTYTESTDFRAVEDISVGTRNASNSALATLDGAIDMVTSMRADLGAIQNRFENVIEVAGVQNENLSAARSRIQDADFAAETANLTRAQILQQAGLASLAQANASPQAVLALLR